MRLFLLTSLIGIPAFAKDHPCQKIKQICLDAKFVKGEAAEGTGLWKDCIEPIMKGTPQPKKAKLPLPSVDPALVSECKAKHASFGEGK